MATETVEQEQTEQQEAPKFDAAAFIKARNEGKPIPELPNGTEEKKPVQAEAKPADPEPEDGKAETHGNGLSRSQRREMNRLREQAAEERGRRLAIEELLRAGLSPTQAAKTADTAAEPQRDSFTTDLEYARAVAKWDAKNEVQQQLDSRNSNSEFVSAITAANEKFAADLEQLPDFDDIVEDLKDVSLAGQDTFVALVSQSDQRAALFYYFGKNPDKLTELLAKSPNAQIAAFHRLEGKLEMEYSKKEAAQATGNGKTAPEPEKPAKDGKSADRDVRLPRPSTEVAARGGAAAPDEPPVGSAAWMHKRNQAQFGK